MNVKLILLEDVEDLGKAGDIVNVTPGHARNYLLPKGLAVKESPAALRQLEARRGKIEAHRKEELEKSKNLASRIEKLELIIPMQAGEDNQLFGSVSGHIIAEEAAKQGIKFEPRRIKLDKPIKELGEFKVDVKLPSEITAVLSLKIVKA